MLDCRQAGCRRPSTPWLGDQQVRPGARLGDIGHAIQKRAMACRWCTSSAATAARSSTKTTQVLHYGRPGTVQELAPGMTFTIEPMLNLEQRDIRELGNDGWSPSSPQGQPRPSGNTRCWSRKRATTCSHAVGGLARPALVCDGHRHLVARGWRQRPSRQDFSCHHARARTPRRCRRYWRYVVDTARTRPPCWTSCERRASARRSCC